MLRMIGTAVVALMLASGAAGARPGDPAVNIAGTSLNSSGDCQGQEASIAGSENTATIRGACRAFQIAGDDNRVLIDMAPHGTIKVFGNNNRVSWTSSGDVEVTTVGPGNTVTRAR
ncbi:MAG TPA: DUF3060 domain-containing protein [Stellaceae bacterium]|jgi:hypothetical protein|nr:DUF3060 domain-containing protein [Stellaceae bacterium]